MCAHEVESISPVVSSMFQVWRVYIDFKPLPRELLKHHTDKSLIKGVMINWNCDNSFLLHSQTVRERETARHTDQHREGADKVAVKAHIEAH